MPEKHCIDRSKGFQAHGINKSFGKHAVLDGLKLDVPLGGCIGLLGANGSGKTTLLKILLGLIAPDAGEVTIAGEPAGSLSPEVRSRIGYVPQSTHGDFWNIDRGDGLEASLACARLARIAIRTSRSDLDRDVCAVQMAQTPAQD